MRAFLIAALALVSLNAHAQYSSANFEASVTMQNQTLASCQAQAKAKVGWFFGPSEGQLAAACGLKALADMSQKTASLAYRNADICATKQLIGHECRSDKMAGLDFIGNIAKNYSFDIAGEAKSCLSDKSACDSFFKLGGPGGFEVIQRYLEQRESNIILSRVK